MIETLITSKKPLEYLSRVGERGHNCIKYDPEKRKFSTHNNVPNREQMLVLSDLSCYLQQSKFKRPLPWFMALAKLEKEAEEKMSGLRQCMKPVIENTELMDKELAKDHIVGTEDETLEDELRDELSEDQLRVLARQGRF